MFNFNNLFIAFIPVAKFPVIPLEKIQLNKSMVESHGESPTSLLLLLCFHDLSLTSCESFHFVKFLIKMLPYVCGFFEHVCSCVVKIFQARFKEGIIKEI